MASKKKKTASKPSQTARAPAGRKKAATAKKAARKPAAASKSARSTAQAKSPNLEAQERHAHAVALACARALDEANCQDVRVFDLRGMSPMWDYLVIASGASERQMKTAIDKATEAAEKLGQSTFGPRRDRSPTWMVLDFIDVVVHVFEPGARATYDLEMLWGDAPRVEWTPDRSAKAARTAR